MSRRLIPAHAGKTRGTGHYRPAPAAHPRSRGENFTDLIPALPRVGSSPLTRGKRCSGGSAAGSPGLIPAHAGKTWSGRTQYEKDAAHPRSRGENLVGEVVFFDGVGSSPLTRGKRLGMARRGGRIRLIPAHAGKTGPRGPSMRAAWAHPRSRGENTRCTPSSVTASGSSPLTRGKRHFQALNNLLLRLIPAHAGKTPQS